MQKNRSSRHLLLVILIPPVLAACLCIAILIPRVVDFFSTTSYPDYLWALRITHELSNEGYPVADVSVLGSDIPGVRTIHVQIGNLLAGKQQRSYELVKEVHSVIIKTFANATAQPDPVNEILVTIIDYSSGSYMVSVDFETAQKYFAGDISDQTYFEHWSYPENTPGITPP
jgi:hypothetical protein